MDKDERKKLSKTLSHALRHEPESYHITLDEAGWTPLEELLVELRGRRAAWGSLTRADVEQIIETSEKRRFELDGERIRAIYGHSTEERIAREAQEPPVILYHGTPPEIATLILEQGLKPMSRQYVHLSVDVATAREVGRRRSAAPTILIVEARRAHQAGHTFYLGHDLIWLSDPIPPEFIKRG